MKKYLYFFFSLLFLTSCDLEGSDKNLLADTSWELYGYKDDGMTTLLPLTDTLVFGSKSAYTFNGTQKSYQLLALSTGNETIRLSLNDTRFGSISGIVAIEAIKQGGILGETFSRTVDEKAWQLWFRKIN
jgi:hypothetical protein